MQRFGAGLHGASEMGIDDILLCRTDLLTHMAEYYLHGAQLGDHQKQAIALNARHIGNKCDQWMQSDGVHSDDHRANTDHDICQRLMRLARAMKAVAIGHVVDIDHETMLRDDADFITSILEEVVHDYGICKESCLSIELLSLMAVF